MFKLKVNDKIFQYFATFDINLRYNAIADSFSFTALKEMLPGILEYPDCIVLDDEDNYLIKGTILNQSNRISTKQDLITVSGYSKCGILEDINIPTELYPLQTDKLSLKQIVDKILPRFDIEYIADESVTEDFNKIYKKSSANPEQTIKDYINTLASQRGIILTHTWDGKLLFTKITNLSLIKQQNSRHRKTFKGDKIKKKSLATYRNDISDLESIAYFEQGDPSIIEMTAEVDGQSLHSDITVIKQASSGNPDAGEKSIRNPYFKIYRPKVKILNSGDLFDMDKAVRNELSDELSKIKITLNTLVKVYPGNIITVKAPGLRINYPAELFVEEVSIKGTIKSDPVYTLSCVVKDVYTDSLGIKSIFRDLEDEEDYSWGLPKF